MYTKTIFSMPSTNYYYIYIVSLGFILFIITIIIYYDTVLYLFCPHFNNNNNNILLQQFSLLKLFIYTYFI